MCAVYFLLGVLLLEVDKNHHHGDLSRTHPYSRFSPDDEASVSLSVSCAGTTLCTGHVSLSSLEGDHMTSHDSLYPSSSSWDEDHMMSQESSLNGADGTTNGLISAGDHMTSQDYLSPSLNSDHTSHGPSSLAVDHMTSRDYLSPSSLSEDHVTSHDHILPSLAVNHMTSRDFISPSLNGDHMTGQDHHMTSQDDVTPSLVVTSHDDLSRSMVEDTVLDNVLMTSHDIVHTQSLSGQSLSYLNHMTSHDIVDTQSLSGQSLTYEQTTPINITPNTHTLSSSSRSEPSLSLLPDYTTTPSVPTRRPLDLKLLLYVVPPLVLVMMCMVAVTFVLCCRRYRR